MHCNARTVMSWVLNCVFHQVHGRWSCLLAKHFFLQADDDLFEEGVMEIVVEEEVEMEEEMEEEVEMEVEMEVEVEDVLKN